MNIQNKGSVIASDGLIAREVGEWSEMKSFYFERYVDMFTTSMREKWKLTYIDLFSGPGKCIVRDSGKEFDGSPITALKSKFKFHKYIFVDENELLIDALKQRVEHLGTKGNINFINGDCNKVIDKVKGEIIPKSLCFAFIDPTGLQINWDTVLFLVKDSKIDLMFTFMYNMGIRRNIGNLMDNYDTAIDRFLPPGFDWRDFYKKSNGNFGKTTFEMLKHYVNCLKDFGYEELFIDSDLVPAVNSRGNILYYLLLVSKDKLGMKFWREDIKKEFSQRRLFS